LYLTRRFARPPKLATAQQIRDYVARTHRTPPKPINWLLETVLSLEATVGNYVHSPWGTSILGVFRR
jgi:hypothetical protein